MSGDQFVFQLVATENNPYIGNSGTFIDTRDGQVYKWVKIGTQIWMAENLKAIKYQNGDPIQNVINNAEWAGLTSGAYCNYANDINIAKTYGRLYNWYAVSDSRNIAPIGWHVPTDAEWFTLVIYLGGESVAGGKLKETGTSHWQDPNTGATNETGFSALPGGSRTTNGTFHDVGSNGYWWSSTVGGTGSAWYRLMYYDRSNVYRYDSGNGDGFSVRCVRD
jgi:uncharacterized protein (TIGR02145 family)